MNPFDLAEDFDELCTRSTRVAQLSDTFQHHLENLGFRYFACASHVDPLHPRNAVMLLNYPRNWVECYSEKKWYLIDPVFHRADRSRRAFYWDDPHFYAAMTRDQRKMQRLARQFGVAHGYTVPIHGPLSSSSCSVVPDSLKVHRHNYLAVEIMALRLYDRIAQLQHVDELPDDTPILNRRERQCLTLVGQGKGDIQIGTTLGVQRSTAHNYVEGAKKRLGLRQRTPAVLYAIGSRQIRLEDILRALHPVVRRRRAR